MGVTLDNISIKIVNIFDKLVNELKLTISLRYIVEGNVLKVNKIEVKKLFSKLIFSKVRTNEKTINNSMYSKSNKLLE
tara:strand:+ start:128 stop:361 length:234 start_codon:yes stop_codon:yes gene_type:complete